MRRAAKIDDIQGDVVQALRKVGASVEVMSAVGQGFPDILVGYQGHDYKMELKDPGARKRYKGTKLTQDQWLWHQQWSGSQVFIVESVEHALAVIGF